MHTWLHKNWHWIITNIAGIGILTALWLQFGVTGGTILHKLDPFFEQAGRWSVRFLLICLAMTPLHRVFGWRQGLKLRKPVGLWAFAFAVFHYADFMGYQPFDLDWIGSSQTPYFYYLGAVALLILSLMALTSTQLAQRVMKKWWKRLHRLVYAAALMGFTHGLIAATSSKRMFMRSTFYIHELQFYLVILIILLCLRVPVIQHTARKIVRWPGRWTGTRATSPRA